MKKIYLLTTLLFLTIINLNAQTVTLTGSCAPAFLDGDYTISADINGRPSFIGPTTGGAINIFLISWTGTRWEHTDTSETDPALALGMYNTADTATPPASAFFPWTAQECAPAGAFTGDGTSSAVLSSINPELTSNNIKISPIPASNHIFITGLTNTEDYKIYSSIGVKISEGRIQNGEKIDTQNLSKGLYFFNFKNGNTFKFIKQ